MIPLSSKEPTMSAAKIASLLTALILAGCGTYVPEFQEYGDQTQAQKLIQAIVQSIHCELRNAVSYAINQDYAVAKLNNGARSSPWFDDWGVQIALSLTVDEKSTVNPTFSWVPNPVTAL